MFQVEGLGQLVQKKKRYRAGLLSQICHPLVQHWHTGRFHTGEVDPHSGPGPRKCHSTDGSHGRTTLYDFEPQLRTFRKRIRRFDEAAEHADILQVGGDVRLRLQVDKFDVGAKQMARRTMMFLGDGWIPQF